MASTATLTSGTDAASASARASTLASMPASLGKLHVPAVDVLELQIWPDGHPLPEDPRQPLMHAYEVVLQTRPLVALPQSVSAAQPQTLPCEQVPVRHTVAALEDVHVPVAPG